MALLLLHALLLAGATAAVALESGTGGDATTICSGAGCTPPAQPQPLPIYGYPPPSPSLPSAPPAQPSTPGVQAPCPPAPTVVCCGGGGGAAGQNAPQQPYNYAPPTGYLPYYNNSASPPVLPAPVAVGYHLAIACLLFWVVVQ